MDSAAEKPTSGFADPNRFDDSVDWGSFDGSVNQSLQRYLRELGQLPRMTPEEQSALGLQILSAENLWRSNLNTLAFCVMWQLEYLQNHDMAVWKEQFLPSAVDEAVTLEDLQAWHKKLSGILLQLQSAFAAGTPEEDLEKIRQDMLQEVARYKLSSDILMQCHDQLQLVADTVPPESIGVLAAESCCSEEFFRAQLQLIADARQRLLELRQQMVEGNLRLVIRIVNQYSYRQLSVSDLVQEGNLGLMRSLEKFDFNLKHKFSTYASWWIRQSIGRAIAEQFRVIRIPAHMVSTIAAINRVEQRFILEHDRMPEVDEIAAILEMPPARVSAIRKMARQTISLQSPLSVDASGSSLEDVLPDDHAVDPSQKISEETIHRQLEQLLAGLSERERMILTMRFGLMGEKVRTLQEISEYFDISRERVRQLEMQTLNKLRTPENMRIFGSHKS
ncbi:MAG: sigma-70 family RNA polymerase sigma factor [Lentisphaerae bacterium]|nr:sigma-70 family RNA polymerase sigma factor [Lentisphaerota bacterium]